MVVPTAPGEQLPNGCSGQSGLGKEPNCWACCDQLGIVLLAVCRNQDHGWPCLARLAREPLGKLQTALAAEVDIEQDDVRTEFLDVLQRLRGAGRDPNDYHALPLQEAAGRI